MGNRGGKARQCVKDLAALSIEEAKAIHKVGTVSSTVRRKEPQDTMASKYPGKP